MRPHIYGTKQAGPRCIGPCRTTTLSMCRRCREYVCGDCLPTHDCQEAA